MLGLENSASSLTDWI
jgi:hypothetical protein